MAIYMAKNGQLQMVKGIYYGMTEHYIDARLFHNLVPKTATEIRFLYASNNPDLTGYQMLGYCDNNNFIEVWNSGTKYILINPRKNYIYAPINCICFLYDYTALTDCVFDNFDTRYVTNMFYMFFSCSRLTSLDLSRFNTQNVTNMYGMFNNCSSLTSILCNTFDKTSLNNSNTMFSSCTALVGGNGTTYNGSYVDANYARVDGENGLPGYFTAPTN